MTSRGTRVLLAGPLPPPIGGTTLLFERLVNAMEEREDIETTVVDTSGVRGKGPLAAAAFAVLQRELLNAVTECDVATLHVSTTALHIMGPVISSLAGRHRVPLVVRKFGGTDFLGFDWLRRRIIVKALSAADLYLAETRMLVESARSAGIERVEWHPNSRQMPPLPHDVDVGHERCERFVFLGQVHRTKGIPELIEAAAMLEDGARVDVFGTLGHDVEASAFEGAERVRFRGRVEPDQVHETLASYDALVLPSYHEGEGYPGVVLEAFGAGLPVVTTRWRALPELVDETCGALVPPRDADALAVAMNGLAADERRYRKLREGVRERRELYDESRWHDRFVEICRELAGPGDETQRTGSGA